MKTSTKKVRRVGSGRTKGSYSFVVLTLGELKAKFADDSIPVIVSRKWAEPLGFSVASTTDAKHLSGSIQGKTPDSQITAKVDSDL